MAAPASPEHPEGVPGRVARGQNQGITRHGVSAIPLCHDDLLELMVRKREALQAMAKTNLAAAAKSPPGAADHLAEEVGSHMGLMLPKDILRGPCRHEGLHHLGQAGVMGSRGEFSIGKGPGTPFPKLNVGLRVQVPALPEGLHVLHPLLDGLARSSKTGRRCPPGQSEGRQTAPASPLPTTTGGKVETRVT